MKRLTSSTIKLTSALLVSPSTLFRTIWVNETGLLSSREDVPLNSYRVVLTEGSSRSDFPITLFGVAGTQAARFNANSIVVFKMSNLHQIRSDRTKDDKEDSEDSDEDEDDDPEKAPKLRTAAIRHNGSINRIRFQALGPTTVAAAWAEKGTVGIWSLNRCLEKLEQPQLSKKDDVREKSAPIFEFQGHMSEGARLESFISVAISS